MRTPSRFVGSYLSEQCLKTSLLVPMMILTMPFKRRLSRQSQDYPKTTDEGLDSSRKAEAGSKSTENWEMGHANAKVLLSVHAAVATVDTINMDAVKERENCPRGQL